MADRLMYIQAGPKQHARKFVSVMFRSAVDPIVTYADDEPALPSEDPQPPAINDQIGDADSANSEPEPFKPGNTARTRPLESVLLNDFTMELDRDDVKHMYTAARRMAPAAVLV